MLRGMADAETWKLRVAEWRASGLTSEQFAQTRGFAGSTLLWWSSRFRRAEEAVDDSPPQRPITLARVVPITSRRERGPSGVAVQVGGCLVRLDTDFDRATFSEAVAALLELGATGDER